MYFRTLFNNGILEGRRREFHLKSEYMHIDRSPVFIQSNQIDYDHAYLKIAASVTRSTAILAATLQIEARHWLVVGFSKIFYGKM